METIVEKIKEARSGRARHFVQSWDFLINVKNLDLKKPEHRFTLEVSLPDGRGRQPKVAVFADSLLADAKQYADLAIPKSDVEALAKDPDRLKGLAEEYDWFFGEVTLMALIGKTLGQVLGPRNKIPKPLPPKSDVKAFVERARSAIRVSLKENPVIHTTIGIESMTDEQVAANARAVFTAVKDKLPKGLNNIRSVYIKLTMGRPIRVM